MSADEAVQQDEWTYEQYQRTRSHSAKAALLAAITAEVTRP